MSTSDRLPIGFKVEVLDLGLGRFDVSVNHLGYRVAYCVRTFSSPDHALAVGISSANALADRVDRGFKL